ncbi:two-component system, LytT family, response regulator [Filimonas lacunae]|uniref:Two-component system, LytT family, response regulator n=1 Tax=Filimonas lacunae TaxID=477680 RepID=A0A173MMA5_9BACT|nr:LytTR family DNA-binding domain-containing protein [Filimonas lacunae]BAV08599.1 response regulator [Filimonas lacunae]SIS58110.1 two-component system, LytT family, response regulator [Filimonas lacunae]
MIKVIVADEEQQDISGLVEKLSGFMPGVEIIVDKRNTLPAENKIASDTIMLQSAREVHFIPVSQIVRVLGENNYSVFTLANGRKITVARTLRDYEAMLLPHHFYRIHKSHIINLNYLVKVNKGDEFLVQMTDGAVLEVATRRKTDFLRCMHERCV